MALPPVLARLSLVLAVTAGLWGQSQPVRILFVGDMMLDNGPGHLLTNGEDPFAPTAATLRDADFTLGNLECVITRHGYPVEKPYVFKGPRAALPLLKKYFTAVSLANNHSGDWGPAGFADELALLREHGIAYFGGGANQAEARKPLLLEAQGKRIAVLAFCDYPPRSFAATSTRPGSAWLTPKRVIEAIHDARTRLRADYVLLFLHWGIELQEQPEPYEREMARSFIEAGADAIIGGHPHVTQTIEWLHGKPIVYSLGNYLFDYYPGDPRLWTAWMARLTLGDSIGLELFHLELDPAGVPRLSDPKPERITP
jgi:poly-gamma-glutamate synthesis protein (capsule biosynthesis protein)